MKKAKGHTAKIHRLKTVPRSKAHVSHRASAGRDVIQIILDDHKPLKRLIRVMKDAEARLSSRQSAFAEFAPLLLAHAKPEEQALYMYMKEAKQLREEGFEGDVEHGIADQLIEMIRATSDEDLWSARVKVLAELVEHHIEEEEKEMFPEFKKETERDERIEIGHAYLEAKSRYETGSEPAQKDRELLAQV